MKKLIFFGLFAIASSSIIVLNAQGASFTTLFSSKSNSLAATSDKNNVSEKPSTEFLFLTNSTIGEIAKIRFETKMSKLSRVDFYTSLNGRSYARRGTAKQAVAWLGCSSSRDTDVWESPSVRLPQGKRVFVRAVGFAKKGTAAKAKEMKVLELTQDFQLQPRARILFPQFGACVDRSFTLTASLANGSSVLFDLLPSQEYSNNPGKDIPKLDQNVEGAEASGDKNGDGKSGDSSCYPTAAAASLAWFAEHGYPQILPPEKSYKDLVNTLAGLADTRAGEGTDNEPMKNAIEHYLESVGINDWEVKLWQFPMVENSKDPKDADNITKKVAERIAEELRQKQDVLLAFQGGIPPSGHAVTVNNIDFDMEKGEGEIEVMDPTGGEYQTMKITHNKYGLLMIEYRDSNITLRGATLLTVSPPNEHSRALDLEGQSTKNGVLTATVNITDIPKGSYLLKLETDHPRLGSSKDYQFIKIGC